MKEKTYKTYIFSELEEKVQEDLIQEFRNVNVECDFWYEYVVEGFIEDMKDYGFDIESKDIQFSGFGHQSDGASFECSDIDLRIFIDTLNATERDTYLQILDDENIHDICLSVGRCSSHYFHSITMHGISDWLIDLPYDTKEEKEEYDYIEMNLNQLHIDMTDFAKESAHRLYKDLETEHDNMTSDETVIEFLVANEYGFFEDGRMA